MDSNYKNKPSIVLENGLVRAEIIPDPGGKMVSLKNSMTGYEFLVQRPGMIYKEQPFAGSYVAAECSGFDDMFPTIDECDYTDFPWHGTRMADHGEVWSLPWTVEAYDDKSAKLSTHGIRFPYALKKNYEVTGKSVRIAYSLQNLSPFPFNYLWAGHAMIYAEEGMTIKVPDDCREMVSVLSNGASRFGDGHRWPWLVDKDGKPYRADIFRSRESGGFEKYYFTNPLRSGWCRLDYPDGKTRCRIDFSTETVPYLGILVNENGWDGLFNIIVEPCSICYDRPDVAQKFGQTSTLPPWGTVDWTMSFSVE